MAEFAGDLNSFKPCLPFLEIDSNNELINHFGELNPSFLENPNLSIQSNMGFPNDNFLSQSQHEFPANFAINLPGFFSMDDSHANANATPVDHSLASAEDSKKRKVMQVSDTSSGNSSTPVVDNGLGGTNNKTKKKNTSGRRKRGRNNEKEVEKPKEVIHVRARRDQATDSHSVAERVRREKINEKLRCLQDLVPGCYKVIRIRELPQNRNIVATHTTVQILLLGGVTVDHQVEYDDFFREILGKWEVQQLLLGVGENLWQATYRRVLQYGRWNEEDVVVFVPDDVISIKL